MKTTKEFKDHILSQLDMPDSILCRSMMGEYLLYYNNILFGGLYNNGLFIKITKSNDKYNLEEAIPYEGAKVMYKVSEDIIANKEFLKQIIIDTCKCLPIKKK